MELPTARPDGRVPSAPAAWPGRSRWRKCRSRRWTRREYFPRIGVSARPGASARLPEKYRLPLVLCELEGRPRKEVARQLELVEGTLSSRLATGRRMLAKRLTRRGVTLSSGVLAAALASNVASACMPASLVVATTKAASLFANGQTAAASLVSAKAAALTEGVLKTMLLTKLKIGAIVLLVFAAAVVQGYPSSSSSLQAKPVLWKAKQPTKTKSFSSTAQVAAPAREPDGKALKPGRLRGRFTAADTGKPVAGAVLQLLIQGVPGEPAVTETVSDADGRYTAQVPFGHCNLWGVTSPAGYYTHGCQDFRHDLHQHRRA